jgi:hypothetical protein
VRELIGRVISSRYQSRVVGESGRPLITLCPLGLITTGGVAENVASEPEAIGGLWGPGRSKIMPIGYED